MTGTLTPAWVLHRRPYRDSSVLVELFTEGHGRLGAVARGVVSRGWQPLLEPFTPLLTGWSGRGELKTLTTVDAAGAARTLRGEALACGFYLAELLLRLTRREDPHPDTWYAYGAALEALDAGGGEAEMRRFEVVLLQEAGYGMQLREDRYGQPIDPGRSYCYRVEQGAEAGGGADADEGGVPVCGETLLALSSGELNTEMRLREARRLMRVVMHHHLGGRPLRSRELFKSFRAAGRR